MSDVPIVQYRFDVDEQLKAEADAAFEKYGVKKKFGMASLLRWFVHLDESGQKAALWSLPARSMKGQIQTEDQEMSPSRGAKPKRARRRPKAGGTSSKTS